MEEIKIILNDNLKFIIIAFIAFTIDFITGFTRAALSKNIKSSKLKRSIIKFIYYFAFIIIGGCLEILFPSESGKTLKIQIICLAIAGNDFLSVIENGKDIIKIPIITDFIKNLKNKYTE